MAERPASHDPSVADPPLIDPTRSDPTRSDPTRSDPTRSDPTPADAPQSAGLNGGPREERRTIPGGNEAPRGYAGVSPVPPALPPLGDQERNWLRERYEEVAALAGGLAHEIRNPLSTIGMLLELMSEELQNPQSPRDRRLATKVQTVQRECRHLEEILSAFLQFARAGELELTDDNLNQVVREFIDFYKPEAREHGIEISPHLASDLPIVRIDRSLVRQMLMNLALNAQQAMPEGGLLELQTKYVDGRVQLALIDSGIGMDEATRSKLFQVFFSTKAGGSGLGLPTVRKIVEAHDGTISCDSEPGRGTRFLISLPPAEP
jgi:two-component system, NtrC family, sensor histidine kinase HydH